MCGVSAVRGSQRTRQGNTHGGSVSINPLFGEISQQADSRLAWQAVPPSGGPRPAPGGAACLSVSLLSLMEVMDVSVSSSWGCDTLCYAVEIKARTDFSYK